MPLFSCHFGKSFHGLVVLNKNNEREKKLFDHDDLNRLQLPHIAGTGEVVVDGDQVHLPASLVKGLAVFFKNDQDALAVGELKSPARKIPLCNHHRMRRPHTFSLCHYGR